MSWNCPECGKSVEIPKMRGPHLSGCRRSKNAKYIYFDGKNPKTTITCIVCGAEKLAHPRTRFCSMRCAQDGEHNSVWKGDEAGYLALHGRVYKAKGKAFGCTRCGTREPGRRYEWANLSGNYTDIDDFASMCKPCHALYDAARRRAAKAAA